MQSARTFPPVFRDSHSHPLLCLAAIVYIAALLFAKGTVPWSSLYTSLPNPPPEPAVLSFSPTVDRSRLRHVAPPERLLAGDALPRTVRRNSPNKFALQHPVAVFKSALKVRQSAAPNLDPANLAEFYYPPRRYHEVAVFLWRPYIDTPHPRSGTPLGRHGSLWVAAGDAGRGWECGSKILCICHRLPLGSGGAAAMTLRAACSGIKPPKNTRSGFLNLPTAAQWVTASLNACRELNSFLSVT